MLCHGKLPDLLEPLLCSTFIQSRLPDMAATAFRDQTFDCAVTLCGIHRSMAAIDRRRASS